MTEKTTPSIQRPLSPHLQIYRPQITTVLSILHRITGVALVFGTTLLVAWLCAAAYSPDWFSILHQFFSGIVGRLLLIGWSYAFYFHFCNGIRHLFWDIGKGFEIHTATRTGWLVVFISLFFTISTWASVFMRSGVLPHE